MKYMRLIKRTVAEKMYKETKMKIEGSGDRAL